MKAYIVSDERSYEDYATIVFAETCGKAKAAALSTDACEDAEFTDIRALRVKELDRFYRGASEMDWYDEQDRIGMVRFGGMHCSWEIDKTALQGEICSARKWCNRYEEVAI